MPRPRCRRRIGLNPETTYFKPSGVPMRQLQEVNLTIDEFEAIRLKDLLGMSQKEAAAKMNISQPTFHRLVSDARRNLADGIVNGKAIRIYGGNFLMD